MDAPRWRENQKGTKSVAKNPGSLQVLVGHGMHGTICKQGVAIGWQARVDMQYDLILKAAGKPVRLSQIAGKWLARTLPHEEGRDLSRWPPFPLRSR